LEIDENKKSLFQKFIGRQYTHPYENIGQIFHELVIIPTLFFYPDELSIIHGSALELKDKKGIIIGGTGGVGKTSLELLLISKVKSKFLSDDITIIDKAGYIWPNYAYPKIYRYNTVGKKSLEKKVLQDRGFLDKVQWNFIKFFPDRPSRRRVNPKTFYDEKIGFRTKVSDYFILFRGNYKDFDIRKISSEEAAKINLEIIKTEYSMFFKHLFWHKVNRSILNDEQLIDADLVLSKWYSLQKKVLSSCRCNLVEIPMDSDISELEEKMLSYLKQ